MRGWKMPRPLLPLSVAIAVLAGAACGGGADRAASPTPALAPAESVAAATPAPSVTPAPTEKVIKVGALVEVVGTGACLNMRASPGLNQPVVACRPDGFIGFVRDGPTEKDGHRWWGVEQLLREGPLSSRAVVAWASQEFLRYSPRADNQGVWAIDLEGGQGHHLGGSAISQIAWAPDSRQLAFGGACTESRLLVAAPDGSGLRQLATVRPFLNRLQWLPTGEIEYGTSAEGTFRVKADGSALPVKLSDVIAPARPLQVPAPSPDSRWAASVTVEDPIDDPKVPSQSVWAATVRVYVAPADGGARRLVAEVAALSTALGRAAVLDLQWAPDSRRLAFTVGMESACG